MNALGTWWHKLSSSAESLDAEALREDAVEQGADAIEDGVSGQITTLTGTIHCLVLRPEGNTPALEAELFDGSGKITLIWLGRRKIQGLHPGTYLAVTGRLVRRDGRLAMFNPNYAIFPKAGAE